MKENLEKKKKVPKKVGLIACLVGGIYGVYQLANSDDVKELVTHLVGNGSKLQEQIKEQIKQCVKEALIEYEVEKQAREDRLIKQQVGQSKKRRMITDEIIEKGLVFDK